ncbi:TIGR03067 domain-containing protein [Novipirellula artificiosorum]|nr:TIGR03067 domain-containing protein [Novipirellula artificiosorum]
MLNAHADTPIEAHRLDARLDGVWILNSMQRGGEKVEGDDLPVRMRGTTRTIKGNQMILARGGAPRQLKCTITVDTSTKPHQMDISVEKDGKVQVLKCIYEIKEDQLRIAENVTGRPETFTPDPSATRTLVTTYVRQRQSSR